MSTLPAPLSLESVDDRLRALEVPHLPVPEISIPSALSTFMRTGEILTTKALTDQMSSEEAEGGLSIHPTVQAGIKSLLSGLNTFRHLARSTTISTDALEILADEESLDAGWVMEKGDRPTTKIGILKRLRIPAHELYAKPRATQRLLDDSMVDLDQWIIEKIAQQFLRLETLAFLYGDGENKPKGLLHDTEGFGKLETENLSIDDLIEAVGTLRPDYHRGASFLMSPATLATLRQQKDDTGGYLWQPSLKEGQAQTLLGFPVHVFEEMPKPQDSGVAIAFGNFQEAYQIVDRAGLKLLRDPFSAKPYVEFYATKRVGGNVINKSAVQLITITGTEE